MMGPGGIVDAARAATAGTALRAWGGLVDDALAKVAEPWSTRTPPMLEIGLSQLRPVPRELVHAKGWELRHAFVWRLEDGRCVQRGAFAALSVGEHGAGGIDELLRSLALRETLDAAVAVQYGPRNLPGRINLHAAMIARTTDGDHLVVDHALARSDDGVMPFDDWIRRGGGTRANTTVLSPLELPPARIGSGGGGPMTARRHSSFTELADHLVGSWDRASAHRLAQVGAVDSPR